MAISYVENPLPLNPNTNAYPALFPRQNPTAFFFCQDYPTPLAVLERKPNVFWVQPTLLANNYHNAVGDKIAFSSYMGNDYNSPIGSMSHRSFVYECLLNHFYSVLNITPDSLKGLWAALKDDCVFLAENGDPEYVMPDDTDTADNIALGKHILKCMYSIGIFYDNTTIYGSNPPIPFAKFTNVMANLPENNYTEFTDPAHALYGALGRKRFANAIFILVNLIDDIQFFQELRLANWANITSSERGVTAIKTIFDEFINY